MRKVIPMTDKQFLRFRKQYERKQKEECKPHRGFFPNGFTLKIKQHGCKNRINEWIKYSERREKYEKINDSPAGGDVCDRLPFE